MTEYREKTSRKLPHRWHLRLLDIKIIIKEEKC
jgi:hypothetical protein